jgi:acetyl-CoA carboxylase carboxyl transferase subunit alpha
MLRITSEDLLAFKVINGIIPEPEGGAHANPDAAAAAIKGILVKELKDLGDRNPSVLVRYRSQKIRKIGHWNEGRDG